MALKDAAHEVDLAFSREALRGRAWENAFSGATSFLRRRYAKAPGGAEVVVWGVPCDQAVTNRPGARFGPRAIREASTLLPFDPPFGWDGFDPLEDYAILDAGDCAYDYGQPAGVPGRIRDGAAALMAGGASLVTLGGDHSITLPLLQAVAARHGRVAVVQFDAHSDLWPDDDPARIDHGTMMLKAVRMGLVAPGALVQVGIRTVCETDVGQLTIPARDVHAEGPEAVAARIRARVGDRPVYLSFDIDALDPAHAPGTGTPVWGGLASWQAAAMLRALDGLDVVAGDVVEVSPPYDAGGITALAGAHVGFDLVTLCCRARALRAARKG